MRNNFLFSFFFLATAICFAQVNINAPYSRLGVGDISSPGYAYNKGMAGVGVSNSSLFFINNVNPAQLYRNKYTVYEIGLENQIRTVSSNGGAQSSGDMNLEYLALSLPFKKWNSSFGVKKLSQVNYNINTTNPINSSDYSKINYSGSGGLNQLNFTNAFKILNDTASNTIVSAGLDASFIFGQIERNSTSELFIFGATQGDVFIREQRNSYRGFQFKPGIAFRKELLYSTKGATRKNSLGQDTTVSKRTYNVNEVVDVVLSTAKVGKYAIIYPNKQGVKMDKAIKKEEEVDRLLPLYQSLAGKNYGIYILEEAQKATSKEIKAEFIALTLDNAANQELTAEIRDLTSKFIRNHSGIYINAGFAYDLKANLNGQQEQYIDRFYTNGQRISKDTIYNNLATTLTLPSTFRVGFSIDKLPVESELARIWSLGVDVSYTKWTEYADNITETPFQDTYKVAVGGEIIPHVSSKNYFKRMSYRAGVFYGSVPYTINETSFSDFGINFGFSLPVGVFTTSNPPRHINIACTLGQRGTSSSGLVKEKYALISLSFNFNSRWFERYKLGL